MELLNTVKNLDLSLAGIVAHSTNCYIYKSLEIQSNQKQRCSGKVSNIDWKPFYV